MIENQNKLSFSAALFRCVSHATRLEKYGNKLAFEAPSYQKVSNRNFLVWAEHTDFCLGRPPKIGARREAEKDNLLQYRLRIQK